MSQAFRRLRLKGKRTRVIAALGLWISLPVLAVAQTTQDTDGRDLFRGVFFANGPVASALTPYRTVGGDGDANDSSLMQAEEDLMTRMTEFDPSFFGRFSSALRSANQARVEGALHEAIAIFDLVAKPNGFLRITDPGAGGQASPNVYCGDGQWEVDKEMCWPVEGGEICITTYSCFDMPPYWIFELIGKLW